MSWPAMWRAWEAYNMLAVLAMLLGACVFCVALQELMVAVRDGKATTAQTILMCVGACMALLALCRLTVS